MGKPSVPVQKRLFAVSGNRCSFRECKQTLVDKPSGKVTGRICHIKGNQPNSKRHDPNQSEAERQGFGNLLVMCPIHHDVIDTDDKVYTVEVLHTLKAEHEAKHENDAPPAEETVTLFINNVSFDVPDGSVILSANQSGGQVAHTINNNYGSNPPVQSPFRAELAKRHLADTEDPDFARTVYHKKLGWARKREFTPLKTTALLFAHFPKCIYDASSEDELRAWADTNKLRFEPCKHYPFIMGVYPSTTAQQIF